MGVAARANCASARSLCAGEFAINIYKRLIRRGGRKLRGGTLNITFWDGTRATIGQGAPVVGLELRDARIVPRLLLDPELAFGEAIMREQIEIDGSIDDLLRILDANDAPMPWVLERLFNAATIFARARPLSMGAHRRDVSHHYDLGNEFYRRWLDPTMSYSCAYFDGEDGDLEDAQRRKIRHVLSKLRLKAGESLLDVGCGWGALISEAARSHGVHALGITLSEEQRGWFESHRPELPENASAEMELQHYQALAASGRKFDKIVSVGMAEHVGRHNLPGYFEALKTLLKPGGLAMVHCITGIVEEPTSAWLVKYIFPGGYIPGIAELVRELTNQDLIIWDVENIGPNYPITLDKWAQNFEKNVDWVEAQYGAEFVRMWRLYLQFSAASLRVEDVYVHQIVFSNGRPDVLPLARDGAGSVAGLNGSPE